MKDRFWTVFWLLWSLRCSINFEVNYASGNTFHPRWQDLGVGLPGLIVRRQQLPIFVQHPMRPKASSGLLWAHLFRSVDPKDHTNVANLSDKTVGMPTAVFGLVLNGKRLDSHSGNKSRGDWRLWRRVINSGSELTRAKPIIRTATLKPVLKATMMIAEIK